MSILIKGMEMPTSCRDCRFCNGQADTDYGVCAWCDVDGNAHDAYTMQDCPLVPVPPHGRLIDADALIEWLYSDEPNALKAPFRLCTADRSDVIFLVKNAPTIIPASEEGET